jgi:hypothetical protein
MWVVPHCQDRLWPLAYIKAIMKLLYKSLIPLYHILKIQGAHISFNFYIMKLLCIIKSFNKIRYSL